MKLDEMKLVRSYFQKGRTLREIERVILCVAQQMDVDLRKAVPRVLQGINENERLTYIIQILSLSLSPSSSEPCSGMYTS